MRSSLIAIANGSFPQSLQGLLYTGMAAQMSLEVSSDYS